GSRGLPAAETPHPGDPTNHTVAPRRKVTSEPGPRPPGSGRPRKEHEDDDDADGRDEASRRHLTEDPADRPVVAGPGPDRDRAHRLADLRFRPGVLAGPLLGGRAPLPDPVLLPLRLDRVHPGGGALRAVPARPPADP